MNRTMGLVVTHGDIGAELVRVVETVLGPEPGLAALSNRGLSGADLVAAIVRALDAVGPDVSVLVFIDDMGGSCANAARVALRGRTAAAVLTGANLAMLLDFVTWRESLDLAELSRRLVEKGREAIAVLPLPAED